MTRSTSRARGGECVPPHRPDRSFRRVDARASAMARNQEKANVRANDARCVTRNARAWGWRSDVENAREREREREKTAGWAGE